MTKQMQEKLLDKAMTWIVNSDHDVCQDCVYYDKEAQYGEDIDYYLDNGIEPCKHRRENGVCACKKGIAQSFLNKIDAEEYSGGEIL